MANCKVYLGYEDEAVTQKTQSVQHYTVNKIGGYPDWPSLPNAVNFSTICQKCGLNRLLITQCYAPLEKSQYHRTLYIFACINSKCWELSDSWTCVRSQIQDESCTKTEAAPSTPKVNLNWCSGADEWDENDDENVVDGNNVIGENNGGSNELLSDDEEESKPLQMETIENSLAKMQFCDQTDSISCPSEDYAPKGTSSYLEADVELDIANQEEVVSADVPCAPSIDIKQLLLEKAELPFDIRDQLTKSRLQFVPKFISVEEEFIEAKNVGDTRVNELLHRYCKENGEVPDLKNLQGSAGSSMEEEVYEEGLPLHGDRMFHTFVSRLRANPEQILRYSRTAPPVLGALLPSSSVPPACQRCSSRYICELQLMPAFARTLYLAPSVGRLPHLQFLSVLVFTCAASCWSEVDSYVEEPVVVQPEMF